MRRFSLLSVAILLFTFFSCAQNKLGSLEFETRLLRRDSVYNILREKLIDTSEYPDLPIWDTSIHRYGDAYVDTFTVDGNKFRLISPFNSDCTGGNSIFLEKRENSFWINTKVEFNDNIHGGNLIRTMDINNDGYVDITNETRFTEDVYFYNPTIKSFSDAASDNINPEWNLLDSSKNVFCDFQEFKGMSGQIHSTLYTYNGFHKIELFDLELYNPDTDNPNLITKLILRTPATGSIKGRQIEVINLKKPIDTDGYDNNGKYPNGSDSYFDFVSYWKNKYKKLLGYH